MGLFNLAGVISANIGALLVDALSIHVCFVLFSSFPRHTYIYFHVCLLLKCVPISDTSDILDCNFKNLWILVCLFIPYLNLNPNSTLN